MTREEIEAAKRAMLTGVPLPDPERGAGAEVVPTSFSIIDIGAAGIVFRLVDNAGFPVDLALNPVVARALRDSIDICLQVEPAFAAGLPASGELPPG